MKRSEMILVLNELLKKEKITSSYNHWNQTPLSNEILSKIEEYMLPPETFGNCSDPVIYIKIDSPDAGFTIPTHYIAGWDDE